MKIFRHCLVHLAAIMLLAGPAWVAAQTNYNLPDRVARLSYVRGDVSMAPAGTDNWSVADRNRPLIGGDRLYSGQDGRAALEMGDSALRLDENSAADLLVLTDQRVQVQLSQGTANLAVRRLERDQIYEIDTPSMAFVADAPGSYRIDVDPDGYGAIVTVLSGRGTVWGANNTSRQIVQGRSYRFDDRDIRDVRVTDIPYGNDFDRFCADLDSEYSRSTSSRYVADNVIGYSDLDRYGYWRSSSEYGQVWYPSQVAVGWTPYRDGHWAWIQPWGWTWIDDAPWGFAPFHYGRWAYVQNRWGWVPGPRMRRAVYAPALVAFVGNVSISVGSSVPVGWFPLGPRDIYQPPYLVSENYFVNINLGGGRFFQRQQVSRFYNDYQRGGGYDRYDYAYRHNPRAVTVVPQDVFTHARPVARSAERMTEAVLLQSSVQRVPQAQPIQASYAATQARGLSRGEAQQVFARPVVTRNAVPPTSGATLYRNPASPNLPVSVAPRGAPVQSAAGTPVRQPGAFTPPAEMPRNGADQERQQATPVPRGTVQRQPERLPATSAQPREIPRASASQPRNIERQPEPVINNWPGSTREVQPRTQTIPVPRTPMERHPERYPAAPAQPRQAPRESAVEQRGMIQQPVIQNQPAVMPRAPAQSAPTQRATPQRAISPERNITPPPPASSTDEDRSGNQAPPVKNGSSPRGRPPTKASGF